MLNARRDCSRDGRLILQLIRAGRQRETQNHSVGQRGSATPLDAAVKGSRRGHKVLIGVSWRAVNISSSRHTAIDSFDFTVTNNILLLEMISD